MTEIGLRMSWLQFNINSRTSLRALLKSLYVVIFVGCGYRMEVTFVIFFIDQSIDVTHTTICDVSADVF